MKQLFQENRNVFLLLLGLLFVLLVAVYFLFYRPIEADLKQTETTEQTLANEINELEAKIAELGQDDDEIDEPKEIERLRLESKMPSHVNLDEFLLTLNQIELVSNSRIDNISFSYQGNLPERYQLSEDAEDGDDVEQVQAHLETDEEREARLAEIEAEKAAEEQAENDEEDVESSEEEIPAFAFEEMPTGLGTIVASLNVQSPDYEHFQIFLQEIENQERIMIVPTLSFDQPVENDLVFSENPDETINVTVDVMTFYFEG